METIKKIGTSLKNNIPGAILGGLAGWYGAKKYGKIEKKWQLVVISIVSAIAGASIEYKIKASMVKPAVAAAAAAKK